MFKQQEDVIFNSPLTFILLITWKYTISPTNP